MTLVWDEALDDVRRRWRERMGAGVYMNGGTRDAMTRNRHSIFEHLAGAVGLLCIGLTSWAADQHVAGRQAPLRSRLVLGVVSAVGRASDRLTGRLKNGGTAVGQPVMTPSRAGNKP